MRTTRMFTYCFSLQLVQLWTSAVDRPCLATANFTVNRWICQRTRAKSDRVSADGVMSCGSCKVWPNVKQSLHHNHIPNNPNLAGQNRKGKTASRVTVLRPARMSHSNRVLIVPLGHFQKIKIHLLRWKCPSCLCAPHFTSVIFRILLFLFILLFLDLCVSFIY